MHIKTPNISLLYLHKEAIRAPLIAQTSTLTLQNGQFLMEVWRYRHEKVPSGEWRTVPQNLGSSLTQ